MPAVMEAATFEIAAAEVEFVLDDDDDMVSWMNQLYDTMKKYKVEKKIWEKPPYSGLLGVMLIYSAMYQIRNGAI